MKICVVAGARPNFMKIAPIIRALKNAQMTPWLVHTGQHYDERMSQSFFDDLGIPNPDVNLGVGSGTAVSQISEIMRKLEVEITREQPAAMIVVGDVNSTLAAALVANKLSIPLAHVEAGLRSFDRGMPEETNRILTDAISNWLFTSERDASQNLNREGIPDDRIFFVGNVMIDTLLANLERVRSSFSLDAWELTNRKFALLTLHRPSNVDDPERLESILRAVHRLSTSMPVVFSIHPRTRSRMETFGFFDRPDLLGFSEVPPLGYLDMLGLMDSARLVLTDSGGLQEETTALGVPCLTLRENTERPLTVEQGSNRLVGWKTDNINNAVKVVLADPERSDRMPELWDGHAAERIVETLGHELRAISN